MDFPVITIEKSSPEFPAQLLEIHNPPAKLYCRGNISLLKNKCFAVIGTRKFTSYGKEACTKITSDLARNFTIVSGLALGIDAIAHKSTLDVDGSTIAVLGTGVTDRTMSPRTNSRLAQEILRKGGLLISEFEEKHEIFPSDFVLRNRIISGLSKGVLVIEADEESGSLTTARFALEQNRDVYALPGNIFSNKSSGTNKLIQKGAKLVISAGDILEEYDQLEIPKNNEYISTNNPTEKIILDILDEEASADIDTIAEKSQKEISEIATVLSIMEIKGKIKNTENGKYIKCN